ncbi:MAG: M48 family metalloprotease [Flavobacteriia bacterium]|nr:M48 family metalloprotease [Flavobacteriia bacterium]
MKISTDKLLLISSAILGLSLSGISQEHLRSQGEMVEEFTERERHDFLNREIPNRLVDNEGAKKAEYLNQSEFFLSELLMSGEVIYGDSISIYLNDVMARLTANSDDINENIRAYTLRSPVPNAFMTSKGILMVTTGLIAQVQNETELALVIAHEIGHDHEGDIERSIERTIDIEVNNRIYEGAEDGLSLYEYSQERELNADDFALKLMLESEGYNPINASAIFDVLLFSYLPFDDVVFPMAYIAPSRIELDLSKIKDIENDITAESDFDDEESSHPNYERRTERFFDYLLDADFEEDDYEHLSANPLGENRFKRIQRLARLDAIQRDLHERNYVRALYNTYVLSITDTALSDDAEKFVGYALHAIASYKVEYANYNNTPRKPGNEHENIFEDQNTEGKIALLDKFMETLTAEQALGLAIRYNYELHMKHPEDPFILENLNGNINQLIRLMEGSLDTYTNSPLGDTTSIDTLSEVEYENLSKIDKIRYDRQMSGSKAQDWSNSLLYEYAEDEILIALYEAQELLYSEDTENRSGLNEAEFRDLLSNLSEENDEYEDVNLGLREVHYLSPILYSFHIESRYSSDFKLERTMEFRERFERASDVALRAAGLRAETYYTSDFDDDEESTQKFNDYVVLREWFQERLSHVNTPVNNSLQARAIEIADRTGIDHLVVPTAINSSFKVNRFTSAVLMVVFPPSVFGLLDDLYKANDNSILVYFVFDLRSGNAMLINVREYEAFMHQDYLNQMVYDMVFQIGN